MFRRCIYNIPFFIIYALLCVSVFFLDGHSSEGRLWDRYYIVAVPEGSAEGILNREIFKGADIVSEYNTSFEFNDFNTPAVVELNDIRNRFIDGDPRLDPYLAGAAEYFRAADTEGRKYELIYVKSTDSAWDFYFRTRRAAGSDIENWIFPDFSFNERFAAVILFSVCLIFGIFISGGLRVITAAAGIPWVISAAVSGTAMLPAACTIYMLSVLFLRESYFDILFYLNYGKKRFNNANYFFAAGLLAAVIAAAVVHALRSMPVIPVFFSVGAGTVAVWIFYSLKGQRVRMQEHRLFFPVSLTGKTQKAPGHNRPSEICAAAAAAVIIPLFSLFFTRPLPLELPVPQPPAENFSSWSWESLDYIDKSGEGLVNAADLLSHAAYQAGFMYGRDWGFPSPDEVIGLKKYVAVNNEIMCKEVNIRLFTEEWYLSIIKPELSTGLDALLLSQKAPGGIILKSDISKAVERFNPVRHILICILAFLPVFGHLKMSVSITVRRKGQEA